MADITVCEDSKCPDKIHCERYTCTRSYRQSHFMDSPRKGDSCEFFMSNKIINTKNKNNDRNIQE